MVCLYDYQPRINSFSVMGYTYLLMPHCLSSSNSCPISCFYFVTNMSWTEQIKRSKKMFSVDKKNQLDVTFCIFYFSYKSCSTCFGQPCAHHQELTTAWCYSLVFVCAVAAGRWSSPVGIYKAITSRSRRLLMMGTWLPETCWATIRREIKNTKIDV